MAVSAAMRPRRRPSGTVTPLIDAQQSRLPAPDDVGRVMSRPVRCAFKKRKPARMLRIRLVRMPCREPDVRVCAAQTRVANFIRVGVSFVARAYAPVSENEEPSLMPNHVVARGETLGGIAARYGTT